MAKCNVKTGDIVVVITGKDAGKSGKVLSVDLKKNRITVEGVNIVSKHQKARKAQEKSQIVKREGSIDVSNVMILCECGKATRVAYKMVDGKKVRVCKKCGLSLDKEHAKAVKKEVKKANKENATTSKKSAVKSEKKSTATKAVKEEK